MRAKRREANSDNLGWQIYRSFTHAITPEVRTDANSRNWVPLAYPLRYVDLFCARARAEHRITGDVIVVVVVFLALLLRFLHMCAALEVNFVSK